MKNYSLGIYEKAMPDDLEIEEKLLIAKETGYDFLELTIDQNPAKQERLIGQKGEKLKSVSSCFITIFLLLLLA